MSVLSECYSLLNKEILNDLTKAFISSVITKTLDISFRDELY